MGNFRTHVSPKMGLTTSALGSTKAITSAHTTYEDTGMEVTITTKTNEVFLLGFVGMCNQSGGSTTNSFYLAYEIDAGSDIPISATSSTNQRARSISFTVPISGLSAGSHTIKLKAARDSTQDWQINKGTSSTPIFYAQQIG